MNASTRLSLPYLLASQSQKHVTVNEGLRKLDAIVQLSAVSATITSQPDTPGDGDVYILPPGKTGSAWGSMSNAALAYYVDGAWMQLSPREGWLAWVADEEVFAVYTSGAWEELTTSGGGGGGREVLTADRTYYVSTSGSDSNNGLTAGAPLATIQKAYDTIVQDLDTAGFTTTIQLADGTYTNNPLNIASSWSGGGPIIVRGNPSTPANVVWSQTAANAGLLNVTAPLPSTVTVTGITMQTSGSGLHCITMQRAAGTVVVGEGCVFGPCTQSHMAPTGAGATVFITHGYTITGGALSHVRCLQGGMVISLSGVTVTLSGTPDFGATGTRAFARVEGPCLYQPSGVTFSGAATGRRYYVALNGAISTGGGGASFLPGDTAGTELTGGQYA